MKRILYIILIICSLQVACHKPKDKAKSVHHADSERSELVGSWKFIQAECMLLDEYQNNANWNFPAYYADQFKEEHFLGLKLTTELQLRFENDSVLSLSNKHMYQCQTRANKLNLFKSDYVITLDYELSHDSLIITERLYSVVKRTLKFRKE